MRRHLVVEHLVASLDGNPGNKLSERTSSRGVLHTLAYLVGLLGVFAMMAGVFLYIQYNNLSSSFCKSIFGGSVDDPLGRCSRWAFRADLGLGLMVVGFIMVLGVAAARPCHLVARQRSELQRRTRRRRTRRPEDDEAIRPRSVQPGPPSDVRVGRVGDVWREDRSG
jgi:hypothetical protein